MTDLPERVNVMRLVTYDTARVAEIIHEETEKPFDDITLDEILKRIEEWVQGDLGCNYGHEADLADLIWQDENGNSL